MPTGDQERRAHPRAHLAGHAVVYVGDERIGGQAVDISVGGIGVRVHEQQPAGTFVRVNFALGASFGDAPAQWLDADGVIVRTGEGRGCWILGVQFVGAAATVRTRISDYVEKFNEPPEPRRARTDRHRAVIAAQLNRARETPRPAGETPAATPGPRPVPASARASSRSPQTKNTPRPLDQSDPELRGLYRQALQELKTGPKGKKKR